MPGGARLLSLRRPWRQKRLSREVRCTVNSSELPNGLGGCTTERYDVSDPIRGWGRAGGEDEKKYRKADKCRFRAFARSLLTPGPP